MRTMLIVGILGLAAMLARVSHGQDAKDAKDVKVITQLSPEQTEEILKKLDIAFEKKDPKGKGVFFYDFKRKELNVRLYHYDGKDLMLDAVFPPMPLTRINEWNVNAKFSRACLNRDGKGEFVTLESNLDLAGGVTEGAIKQFINTFDNELRIFTKFAGSLGSGGDDTVFAPVTGDKIEAVFKSLNIAYDKQELKEGAGHFYDFEASNFKLRLINFAGKDLMIDAHFKKMPLEDLNRWNLEKKFIRAVAYNIKGQEYSALECNLDCEAGTTDNILRNYIIGFQEDVKQFAKYVQGK